MSDLRVASDGVQASAQFGWPGAVFLFAARRPIGGSMTVSPHTKRWAIYARKSNVQDGVAEDARSVARQVAAAKEFIAAKGGSVDEANVYVDDAVSGAFLLRPEFQRMLRDAEAGAFQAVVFYDQDRFSRNTRHTLQSLFELSDYRVEVWDLSTAQQVELDTPVGMMSATMRSIFAQEEREKVRKRVFDAHHHKVRLGHVVCAHVYGYDNVRTPEGHVKRVIDETEAAVVREIYTRFADGEGSIVIAGVLNRAGVVPPRRAKPRQGHGGPRGWSNSTIRAVLERPLYRGDVVWGKNKVAYGKEIGNRDRQGTREKMQVPRAGGPVYVTHDESLRIIDADLAARVDARRQEMYDRYRAWADTRAAGMPDKAHGKYLLTGGMLVCPTCGRHFEARKRLMVYICSTRRRMPGMCSNTVTLPIAATDEAVLAVVEYEILGTRYIKQLLSLVEDVVDDRPHLGERREQLRAEVERLVGSIAAGVPADSVASAIKEREAEIARIEVKLRAPRPTRPDRERLRVALEERAATWRDNLRAEPRAARLILRRLIGPITLWESPHRDFMENLPGPVTLRDRADVPEWVGPERGLEHLQWEAPTKPRGLLDGLVQVDQSQTGS
jgi:site-specific DNA recombinase